MPWITATTATRNPTDTMIPSSVKNERSLWLQAVWSASRIASERGMDYKLRRQRAATGGNGRPSRPALCRPLPPSAALFVPQRLHRIQSRRLVGGIQAESDAGEGRGGEGREHGPERHVRGDGRQAGDGECDDTAGEHPDGAPHQGEGRGLDEELPLDGAPRRSERLANPDLPRALGDRDHHHRDHAHAPAPQPDRREHQHHEQEHPRDLVPGVQELVLGDDRKVVFLPWLEPAKGAQGGHHLVHRLLLAVGGRRRDREPHPSLHERHVFYERALPDADVRGRRTAETGWRRDIYADNP